MIDLQNNFMGIYDLEFTKESYVQLDAWYSDEWEISPSITIYF